MMKRLALSVLVLALCGCQATGLHDSGPISPTLASIDGALKDANAAQPTSSNTPPPEVAAALLPPVTLNLPEAAQPAEPRFDVAVNHVPAQQFFMGLVDGSPYNMVVHPEVGGEISLNLKNVTVDEVMNTVNSVYGYEYSRNGSVYEVLPARLRSHVFKVDYLNMRRIGASQTRVSSGQITQNENDNSNNGSNGSNSSGSSGNTGNTGNRTNNNTSGNNTNNNSGSANVVSGSQVNTQSEADFWRDLKTSLELLVGMVNRQAGIVVVRAMPGELREIGDYLSTLQNAVERQVVLEAKIIEVELNDGFQSGINWAALGEPGNNKTIVVGQVGGGTLLNRNGRTSGTGSTNGTINPIFPNVPDAFNVSPFGGMFGIAANLNDFVALIELLKTQGQVQVLSSPRVSTVNNQKAVIKVGTDEFFVTDIDTNTDTSNGTSNQSVDVQLTPFFSGVALDVIPEINDRDEVILHIHPTISEVTEQNKDISLNVKDTLSIPLARSTIRESDAVVRARSGQVIVIGGLMKDSRRDDQAKTPFLGDLPGIGAAFRHTRKLSTKSELVILLRPHVISGSQGWNDQLQSSNQRIDSLQGSGAGSSGTESSSGATPR
ncbi:MAG: pilus (MSHA type) biogenesis protein MshL [Gammaproteobacteria bacterium]|nr:pilus (MSHA type) biogenesis protein MshL [Gammaproteobacteria bacterium]